jgi:hypothetical protein
MRKRIIGLAVSAGMLVMAFPAAASADTGGWTPVTYGPRAFTAGDVCSFGLTETIVTQGVEEKVVATYPDGTPLQTDFRGPLIARYTNTTTGAYVDEDLSGDGTLYNLPDKSSLWDIPDNFGVAIHAGDPYHAQGMYVLAGQSVVSVSPTHQIAILYQTKIIDVCAALS